MPTKKSLLFPEKFPRQLETWQAQQKEQGKPHSQGEFARQVGVEPYRVSDWKSGRQGIPHTYIEDICRVLGVSPDVYEPKTHAEKYRYDTEFMQTEIGKSHSEFAKQEGLDLGLIRAISKVVDFNKEFPLFAPFGHWTLDPKTGEKYYDRKVNYADSVPFNKTLDEDLRFLQVNRDGKTITMHRADLAYLKEVQDQIVRFVEFLFYERSREMKDETIRFNEDLIVTETDSDGNKVTWKKEPDEEFIREHDRFARVFDQILPETREATQEDWDQFWGKGIVMKKEGK